MAEDTRSGANTSPVEPGPFLAKVVSVLDPTYMGSLEVQLLHEVGNDEGAAGQTRVVKYLSPFYGVTNIEYVTEDPDVYQETQKAYGMWMIPPDVGTMVICIFIGGDVRKGYWMGCVQDENMNFALPGYASTLYAVDDSRETDTEKERVPVGEYNKIVNSSTEDPTKILKPEHPFAKILESQGLLKDDVRGITTSSARRDLPSMVFGFSTPGPVDKTGKIGKFGKKEHKAKGFVSRLGGSTFVMDDGDDKFLRKTTPTEGPPEYATVENDEDDGLKDRPHNELIRLRTRTGHQILLHNSEDLIYIGNSRGTAWVELTSDGKIDIFAEDSINIRTKQDFNFYADRDFNLEVGRNLNIKVGAEMHTHVIADQILIVDANQKIQIKANVDETVDGSVKYTIGSDLDISTGGHIFNTSGGSNETNAGGNIIETAPQIHMNGPAAGSAPAATPPEPLTLHTLPDLSAQDEWQSLTELSTILRRIPTYEPYPQHENLDPEKYKPAETDRDAEARYSGNTATLAEPGTGWRVYSTRTDTFEKVTAPEESEEDQG